VLEENPLADFVELPEHLHDLRWAAVWRVFSPFSRLFQSIVAQIQQHLLRRHQRRAGDGEHQVSLHWRQMQCGGVTVCRVDCTITKDPLCGDDSFEMKLVGAGGAGALGVCVTFFACACGAAGGQVPVQR
jgi:hypothetical protein